MQYFFDILFARINLIIVVFLCGIYILRKLIKNFGKSNGLIQALYKFLRKHHKNFGVLAIILGLVHGMLSSDEISSLNLGTVSWVVLFLLAVSWSIRAKFKKEWLYLHRGLAVLLVGILFFHIVGVGGFTSDFLSLYPARKPSPDSSNLENTNAIEPPITNDFTNKKYVDGIYTGTATGYRPGLVVQVTISQGTIAKISIVSHNERGPEHYGSAMKQVPAEIIKKQSTDVDGVSGTTKTSNGIKNAVNDALTKAANR